MFGQMRDIGGWLDAVTALPAAVITSGAGNDGVEVSGAYFPTQSDFISGMLIISWTAALATTETLTLAANMQDATAIAGTGVADFGDALASGVVATSDGGTTETGTTMLQIPELNGNRGFMRAQVTATLSRGATDTVAISAVFVVGGMAALPNGPGGISLIV